MDTQEQIGFLLIMDKVGVTPIEDKMTKIRLKLFDHIRIRSKNTSVSNRGRPRKIWSEVIRHDLKTLCLTEDMADDRKLWRATIKAADFRVACWFDFDLISNGS